MNARLLRPANLLAAVALIAGILLAVAPLHAMSIVRLAIVTAAAAAGLHALAVNVPPAHWLSPFDAGGRAWRRRRASGEVGWIRARMSGRRRRLVSGPPLPAGTVQLLRPLIGVALERQGVDPSDDASMERAHHRLSSRTLAVLASGDEPAPWYRTVRADRRATAEAVHAVLDDLERFGGGRDAHTPSIPTTPE